MAHTLADRVKETTATTGTGDFTLAGAVNGFLAFSARLGTGDTTWYAAVLGTQWEVGLGTLASATVLQRTTVLASSNGDAAVNFAAGTKEVFLDFPGVLAGRLSDFAISEASLSSAATTDLGAANSRKIAISGTAAITGFGTRAHAEKLVRFTAACTLTHDATTLILPTAANIVTAAGDTMLVTSDASGNWRVRHYQRADGAPLTAGTSADDFRSLAIQVAKLKGSIANLFGGVADDFRDQTGYDTSNSVNAAYASATNTIANLQTDANTILLLHLDGTNGSTTFTDDTGKAVSGSGGIGLSTTQAKFGPASAFDNTNGQYLSVGAQSALSFGTSDWTLECWIYVTAYASAGSIFASGVSSFAAGARTLFLNGSGGLTFQDFDLSSSANIITGSSGDVPLNAWTHVAFVRNGTSLKIYAGGVLKGSATIASGTAFNWNTNSLTYLFGGSYTGSTTSAYYDEARFSNLARYTAAFTPPAAAFAYSSMAAMDLRSAAFAAQAVPTKGSMFVLVATTAGAIAPNSNLIASITRTGNFADATAFALVQTGSIGGYAIYEANGLNLSGQPSGTSMKWRLQTVGTALGVVIDAVVAQWG